MVGGDYQRECFGNDYTQSASWDTVYNTLLKQLQNGYYVMVRVSIRGTCGHFVALDYIDTSSKTIYIMDPGSSTKENLSDYSGRILGYATFKTNASNASQYILNGKRSGSGRGKFSKNTATFTGRGKDSKFTFANINSSISQRKGRLAMKYSKPEYFEAPTGQGRGVSGLVSYDQIKNTSSYSKSTTSSNNNQVTASNNYIGSSSTTIGGGNSSGNGIDLNQLISLISIIANNADKMDAILQLLGAIATNTQNTSTAISNNNKSKTTNNNGLSALRNALDSNSSGIDIANAVYQIAKS